MAYEPQPTAPVVGEPTGGEPKPAAAESGYDFRPHLPENIRAEKTFEKFKGKNAEEVIGKALTSYYNLEKHAGSAVRIPDADAKPDEIAAFNEKIGVPKDADGYEIKEIKLGDEVIADEAGTAALRKWGHANGFTKKQMGAIVDRYVQQVQIQADAAAQAGKRGLDETVVTLRDGTDGSAGWGSLTGRNIALVQRGVTEFFGPEFKSWLDETGAGNDPRFMRGAFNVFQPMMEDGLIKGENLGMHKADAAAEITKLMASKEYASSDRSVRLPVVERIRELSAIAHSDA
jgi:hypothetical protein